jgi:hypothetical protein
MAGASRGGRGGRGGDLLCCGTITRVCPDPAVPSETLIPGDLRAALA